MKKYIWALSLVCFLVSYLVSCGQPPDITRTRRILEYSMAGDQAILKNDYAEAEKQYKNAVALAEMYGPEDPLVFTNLYFLGWLYMIEKKDAEAEAAFQRLIKIGEKIKAQDPEGLARAYDMLATLYLLRSRYSEAEPVYKRALDLYQQAYGADSPKMVEPLKYYAALLRDAKHNDEAADLDARAAKISSNQNR